MAEMQLPFAEEAAKKIKLLILDVDGVLTDGSICLGAQGELFKAFNIKDGLGIAVWHKQGNKTAIITGRQSEMVQRRVEELGITALFQGKSDKRAAYRELKESLGYADEEIAYIGDDLIDLPVMRQVGLAAAVGDAVPEVKLLAHYVAAKNGGRGAVREIIEFILRSQGQWSKIVTGYLE